MSIKSTADMRAYLCLQRRYHERPEDEDDKNVNGSTPTKKGGPKGRLNLELS